MGSDMTPALDRGGRSPNLSRIARQLLRRHGIHWLAELERQASLGDASAIMAITELAREVSRQSPTLTPEP